MDARKALYPALIAAAVAVTLMSAAGMMSILGSSTGAAADLRRTAAAVDRTAGGERIRSGGADGSHGAAVAPHAIVPQCPDDAPRRDRRAGG